MAQWLRGYICSCRTLKKYIVCIYLILMWTVCYYQRDLFSIKSTALYFNTCPEQPHQLHSHNMGHSHLFWNLLWAAPMVPQPLRVILFIQCHLIVSRMSHVKAQHSLLRLASPNWETSLFLLSSGYCVDTLKCLAVHLLKGIGVVFLWAVLSMLFVNAELPWMQVFIWTWFWCPRSKYLASI